MVTRAAFTRVLAARDFGLRTTPKRPAARGKKPLVLRVNNMRRHSEKRLVTLIIPC